ncbi:MAG: hypothetical protein FJ308_12270 [Planctomycetes bacterium]|nr:hypothetical protein [Planctomycetota bacterium]
MTNTNRKTRALSVENLENRQLMAADFASAGIQGNTLVVNGTNNRDDIQILQVSPTIIQVRNLGRVVGDFSNSAISNVQVNLNAGNDRITMNLDQKSLDQVYINMGSGSNDTAVLRFGNVNTLVTDAKASLGSYVEMRGTVNVKAFVDYGTDPGADTFLAYSSSIANLEVKMGGGKDLCGLRNTSVSSASINLGSGNDTFINDGSNVDSGTIDGGRGGNTWRGAKFGRGVRVRNF